MQNIITTKLFHFIFGLLHINKYEELFSCYKGTRKLLSFSIFFISGVFGLFLLFTGEGKKRHQAVILYKYYFNTFNFKRNILIF